MLKMYSMLGTMEYLEPDDWANPMTNGLLQILGYIFLVVAALGVFYAIYLATRLATANDDGKRKQAKDRIKRTFVAIVIVLALGGIASTMSYLWDGLATTQVVTYNLQANSYTLDRVNTTAGAQLQVVRNQSTASSSQVRYEIVSSTAPNARIVNGTGLAASGSGTVTIKVYYDNNVVLANEVIQILPNRPPNTATPRPPNPNDKTDLGETGTGTIVNTNAKFLLPIEFGPNYYGNNVIPRITSNFGMRSIWPQQHTGLDIANSSGTGTGYPNNYIYAAALGTVVTATGGGAYGNYIAIRHDFPDGAITTFYAHLNTINVKVGDVVGGKPGDTVGGKATVRPYGTPIGRMGTTGNSTGIHLHFEIRQTINGVLYYVNPFDSSHTFNNNTKTFSAAKGTGGFFSRG